MRLRPPYTSPAWRAALGFPPPHVWYVVTETSGRIHTTDSETKRDEWLGQYPDATHETLVIPCLRGRLNQEIEEKW